MRLSDAELVRWIPDRSGFRFVGCPNCKAGTQEGQLSWTFDRPDEVFCRYCQMRFPNEKFPENQVIRVTNPAVRSRNTPAGSRLSLLPKRTDPVALARDGDALQKDTATSSVPRPGSLPANISHRRRLTLPISTGRPATASTRTNQRLSSTDLHSFIRAIVPTTIFPSFRSGSFQAARAIRSPSPITGRPAGTGGPSGTFLMTSSAPTT